MSPVSHRSALAQARRTPFSYAVRIYACPGERRRILVALGEAHIKLAPAEALGREIVGSFELRGVETFQKKRVLAGLHAASLYLTVFFGLALVHLALTALAAGSSLQARVTLAMLVIQVHTLLLIPAYLLRRHRWAWLIHPALGLVTTRDMLMAEGTVQMLADHPAADAAVTVMGGEPARLRARAGREARLPPRRRVNAPCERGPTAGGSNAPSLRGGPLAEWHTQET